MIVRLIKKSKIYNFTLPTKVAGNYWITDNDYLGNVRNLINVEEDNGQWKIKSDFETKIMNGDQEIPSAILREYSLYFLKINTDNEYVILYCSPTIERETVKLRLKQKEAFTIESEYLFCYQVSNLFDKNLFAIVNIESRCCRLFRQLDTGYSVPTIRILQIIGSYVINTYYKPVKIYHITFNGSIFNPMQ